MSVTCFPFHVWAGIGACAGAGAGVGYADKSALMRDEDMKAVLRLLAYRSICPSVRLSVRLFVRPHHAQMVSDDASLTLVFVASRGVSLSGDSHVRPSVGPSVHSSVLNAIRLYSSLHSTVKILRKFWHKNSGMIEVFRIKN